MANHRRHARRGSWLNNEFAHMAQTVATWTGHPLSFLTAALVVIAWIVTGPLFGYSDTWQLVINTGTTIVTFLMVFLIQNTQNRDMMAVQLKLTELVLAMKNAENRFASIEDLSDEELAELHEECKRRAEQTWTHIERRRGDEKPDRSQEKPRAAAARAKSQRRNGAARA